FKVVDLWAVFAKFGRVGEVYIPQKRDKRGNRFGFVKFKEVKGVEALSKRLEDVWLGTYKIRTNLSRFGRINSKGPATKDKSVTVLESGGERPKSFQPFKAALTGEPVDKGSSVIDVVDADVALDFLQVLEGSYVGRLGNGVNVRSLQTKLSLTGMQSVRVVTMGGGLVLIFRSSGEEVCEPIRNKGWWGGMLVDIKRWTPNIVSAKRDLWVSLYGIPLHAWGESTFRAVASRCGVFVDVDDVTRNRLRLDVARMKIESSICGCVDFSIKLVVQGASYMVRVVEEGGGWLGREDVFVDDQLQRSEA
ncbi:RNA recognition motif, partial [Trifolium medium]|nr:RNA recognition motif [Trifolium medium]